MADFLSKLSVLQSGNEDLFMQKKSRDPNKHINFMLECKKDGVFLSVVDEYRNKVDVNFRNYDSITAQLLQSIDNVMRQKEYDVVWGEAESGLNLNDYPYLCNQLVRCSNIIDCEGHKLNVADEGEQHLQLRLKHKKGEGFLPEFYIGDSKVDKLQMLSDVFTWIGNKIYAIHSVGNNYAHLDILKCNIDESMLEQYLSVLYSYFSNIQVSCDGYDIHLSAHEMLSAPTLFIEEIDADKTLYLRVADVVKALPDSFVDKFGINMVAQISVSGVIDVKKLKRVPMQDTIEYLRTEILRFAPDRQAKKNVYLADDTFIIPENIAGPFLLNALPSLLKTFDLVGADKLKTYKISAVTPSLNIKLSSGIDFLEGSAKVRLNEEEFTLQQLFSQYTERKYIQLSDGNRAIVDDGYMRRLQRIFRKVKKSDKDRIKVSFFDLKDLEELVNGPLEGKVFEHHRKFYEGFNKLTRKKLTLPNVNATLRPYQIEGVKWIKYLYDNNMGGCLADDMGLGKTLQTISVLSLIYPQESKPTLLVMPRSLLFNWQNELARFAPQLSAYTYYGNTRDIKEAMQHQLILTTYAIVRNDIKTFSAQEFHYVILDESQNIKNLTAQSTQAVFMLKAPHRLALSGTPIENNLGELYALFRFLNQTMFGTLDNFNHDYANPIQKNGDKEAMQCLQRKIFPFMLRRLKRNVLKDLPDRTDKTIYIEMNNAQANLYEQRRVYYKNQVEQSIAADGIQKSQFVIFQALNELRQIASIPEKLSNDKITSHKLDMLTETLLNTVANGHKAVVFFNFIAGLDMLGDTLEAKGIDYVCMTGSTRDRKMVVERFQNNEQCKVMLMTLKTGGVGLNLTAADTVFIFEPWWNKAAEEQAINRLHRFGQKAKVLCFSLITQDTIEEKIQQLQQQKSELFSALINSDSSSSKQLSEEDIKFILG